ncbi:MAG: DUF1697 domain-containing protein [Bacteroidota bacterium]
MNTYILFLRAVNVGGHNIIKMKDLSIWLRELNFQNIRTHLQSGNVVFCAASSDATALVSAIEAMLLRKTNLSLTCLLRNVDELVQINQLIDRHQANKLPDTNLFVTLLSQTPSAENMAKLKETKTGQDMFFAYARDVIVVCQQPYHKTKLSNHLFEQALKVKATSRNSKTMRALLELLSI